MILVDDHFASIVNAGEEGRGTYDNIRKFFAYLISGNIAEVLIVFLGINGHWIDVSNEDIASWTIKIAESSNKESILNDIQQWLRVNLKIKT